MPNYSLAAIGKLLNAEIVGNGSVEITHLAVDSRLENHFPETLFIALKGKTRNGHDHIRDMYEKGTRGFLVEQPVSELQGAGFVVVKDTLKALQELAIHHRSAHELTVVGITGSNGKTIVKEWLHELVRDSMSVVRSPGSWNSQIGVPLSIWNIEQHHELGIFEAGISRPKEMDRLGAMIKPHIGIFTNIGPAHSEGFKDDMEKAIEKALLFKSCENVICCADHEIIVNALMSSGIDEGRLTSWSRSKRSFLRILEEKRKTNHTELLVRCEGKAHELRLPFVDDASIENALHCCVAALVLGIDLQVIAPRLLHLEPLEMRLQVLEGMNGSTILNDAYSNDIASLNIALDRLETIAGGREKSVVISDFHGTSDSGIHREVIAMLDRYDVRTRFFVGPGWKEHPDLGTGQVFETTEELLTSFDGEEPRNKAILIKGARKFRLERLVKRLKARTHGTVLEIDLAAIKHNLDRYRNKLKPDTSLMVMLKAFGYGSGAVEMARMLAFEGVEYFGVAYANEGMELRRNGISTPIFVMNAADTGWDVFARFDLEPCIHSTEQLRSLISYSSSSGKSIACHLELDTGMHRLGFTQADLDGLCELLTGNPDTRVFSIFSHLAASDEPENDAFTSTQIALFKEMSDRISLNLNTKPARHILNSSGITRHAEAQFDMVRLGIGLYGYDSSAGSELKPALTLSAAITQIKNIAIGETVGYSRAFKAARPTRIAIVPMGYADGLDRGMSNGNGWFWVNGEKAPIVGRVCMDMAMLDVTDVPCEVGDKAILFNAQHSLEDVARTLDTIPYEVLSGLSQRIERRYIRDI